MNKNHFCVIMAGGVGSRFWPLSRKVKPKQFLDILDVGQTLLQQTFNRFKKILPAENILIVTNIDYKELVKQQIPEINDNNILLEPTQRNTAPCIAYANFKIKMINPDALIIVAPSDHLILNESDFDNTVISGLNYVEKNDVLLTLGIKPTRPETGYGYIQVQDKKYDEKIKKVKTFTEKPNLEMAKIFLESGDFFWNSGIFIWSLKSISKSFEKYLPEVHYLFVEASDSFNTSNEPTIINKTYAESLSISIDYGIMEKADNVFVLRSDFGWSDLGTWSALYEQMETDPNRNSIVGKNVFAYNIKNCLVNVPSDKIVVLNNLENFIVVENDNILLICNREEEQNIKLYVEDIKKKKSEKYI